MKLSIEFSTDNAAFSDYPVDEIHRIFIEIRERIMLFTDGDEAVGGIIRDSNGNTIGQWSWS